MSETEGKLAGHRKLPPRTYSLVWEEMAWCEGWNVRCNETQSMMREEPFSTERKAQEFMEELEAREEKQ